MSGDPIGGFPSLSPFGALLGTVLTGHGAGAAPASAFTQMLGNNPPLIFILLAVAAAIWLRVSGKR